MTKWLVENPKSPNFPQVLNPSIDPSTKCVVQSLKKHKINLSVRKIANHFINILITFEVNNYIMETEASIFLKFVVPSSLVFKQS